MRTSALHFCVAVTLAVALAFLPGCKKPETEDPPAEEGTEQPGPGAPVPNQLGRYQNTITHHGYLEFFEDGVVHYGTSSSNFSAGTYTMLSTHQVQVNITTFGEGTFETDFGTLHIISEQWVK